MYQDERNGGSMTESVDRLNGEARGSLLPRPNFYLVVTCVGEKICPPPKVRLSAQVTEGTIQDVYRQWVQNLVAASTKRCAKDVYIGATWNAALSAFNEIDAQKFNPHLWVVSCGYGLIPATAEITSYGLTFKDREEESLCPMGIRPEERKRLKALWWNKLITPTQLCLSTPSSIGGLINSMGPQDCLLMAAGADYYQAVSRDLATADRGRITQQCYFIGNPDIFQGYESQDVFEHRLQTWVDRDGRRRSLKNEFGKCNNMQILNLSAQYLIKHYFNKGLPPGHLPAD